MGVLASSLGSSSRYSYQGRGIFDQSMFQSAWNAVSVGTIVGIGDFIFSSFTSQIVERLPFRDFLKDSNKSLQYLESIQFTKAVILSPIVEEIVFRSLIQNVVQSVVQKILPDKSVKIVSYKMHIDTLISILGTSLLFGWAHSGSGLGINHVITTTLAGLVFGIVKENKSLLTAVVAHVASNAFAFMSLKYTNKIL